MTASSTPALFSPLSIRSTVFRNRIWAAPMCQYAVDLEDGVPTDWHLVHLGSIARGGAGLVMTEATGVSPEGRISAEDTGIYTDEQRDVWARIVDFIHSQGAAAGIQLAHAGRKASVFREWGDQDGTRPVSEGGWQTLAPSAIAFDGYDTPVALDSAGIDGVVDDFVSAAHRSVEAGFDVIEVHAAHGYLLHQFLSPLSNLRDDEYGGSLENRARLLLRVVTAVRAAIGEEKVLFVRFSGTDWVEGAWDVEQTTTVARWASEAGADLFDISTGGVVDGVKISVGPGYQVPFAEHVRREGGVRTSAVGLISDARHASQVIESGQADAVMLGRKLLRDPNFPQRAAIELGLDAHTAGGLVPPQYNRARWHDEVDS
ncbi:NADH:flavin oxidoreductase/NADH oxidase [Homoserinimonas aerilata]|uniref:NADH:flavin oxidoreductase/NADH oxidase n=1 Tax=Homoserinimonas aerilata TaxID=1162970 RepID=UPI001FEB299F|nr:NADH:flavin oxidoreductase/NADH oxidase [Homoserinimonas aerilata]